MNPSDFQSKNERTKKYSAFDINCIYQNTTVQAKPTQKNRYGLQRVGQVQGTRRTPKASWIPSVQAESGMQMRSSTEDNKEHPSSSSSTDPPFSQSSSQKSTDSSSISWRKVVTSSLPGDRGITREEMDTGRVQPSLSATAWMENRRLRQESMAGMANKPSQNVGATDTSKTVKDTDSGELVSKSGPPQSLRLQPNVPNKFLNTSTTASNSSGATSSARVPFSQTAVSTGKEKSSENASEARPASKVDNVSTSCAASTLSSKSNSLIASLIPEGSDHIARGMSSADYFSSGWAAMSNDDDELYITTAAATPKASSSEVNFTTSSSSAVPLTTKDGGKQSSSTMSSNVGGGSMTTQPPDTTALHIHQSAYNLPYQQPQTSEHFQSMGYLMNAGSSHQMNTLFSATSQHLMSLHAQSGAFYSGESDKSGAYIPSTLTKMHPLCHGAITETQHSAGPAPLMQPSWPVSASLRHPSAIGSEWAANPMVSSYSGQNNHMRSSYMDNRFVDNEDRGFHETDKQQAYREAVRKGRSKKMQSQEMKSDMDTILSSTYGENQPSSDLNWRGPQGQQIYENVSADSHLSIPCTSIVSSSSLSFSNLVLTVSENSRVAPVITQPSSIHEVSRSHQSRELFSKADSESVTSQRLPNETLQSSNIRSSKTSLISQDGRSRNSSATNKSQSIENYGNSAFNRSSRKPANYSNYDKHSQYVSQDSGHGRQYGYRNDYRRQQDYYDDGYYQDQTHSSHRQQSGGGGSGQYYNKNGPGNASYDNSGPGFYNKASARSLRDEYANEYYSRYGNSSYQQSKNFSSDNKSGQMPHGKEGMELRGSTTRSEKPNSSLSSRDKTTTDGASSKVGRANYDYEEFGEVWIDEGDHNISTKGVHRQNYGGYRSDSRYSSSLTRGATIARGGRGLRGAMGSSHQTASPDKYQRRARTNDSATRQESPLKSSSKYEERDDSLRFPDGRRESEDNTRSSIASGRLMNPMQEKHISAAIQSSFHHISQATPHSSQVVPLLTETECRSLSSGKHKGGVGSGSSGAYSGDIPFTDGAFHGGRGQHGESHQRKNTGYDRMTRDSKVEDHSYGSSSYREESESTFDKQSTMRSQNRPRTLREGRGAYRGNNRSQMFESGPNHGYVRKRTSGSGSDNRRTVRGSSEEKCKGISDDEEGEEITQWETASEGSDLSSGIHNSNELHKTTSNAPSSQRPTIDNDPCGKSSFHHRNNHPRGGSGSSGSAGMSGGNTGGSTCDPSGKSYSTSIPGHNKSESDSRSNQGAKGNTQRSTNSHSENGAATTAATLPASQQNNSALSPSESVSGVNHKDNMSQRPRIKIHIDTSAYSNVVLADSLPQVTEEELYLEAISNAVDCDLIQSDVMTTVENVLGFQEVLSKATKRNRRRQEEQAEMQRIQSEKEQKPATSPSSDSDKSHHRMKTQEKGVPNEMRSKSMNKRESGLSESRAQNSGKKDQLSKEPGKGTFSVPRPLPIGPPTPLLDAEELLSVQPHTRHHNMEGISSSLPPRLAKHHHQTNIQSQKPERKPFKSSFYQANDSSSTSKQSPSSTSSLSQTKLPSNDLISIDEWKNIEATPDSKSSHLKSGASLEIPPVTIPLELVSISTSGTYDSSIPIVSQYEDVVCDNSITKESRSTTERVVWELCETLMGGQNGLSTPTALTIPTAGPHTLSENGDQNSRNANQRARSTSASTCKSAASLGSLSQAVSAVNFGGTNTSSNGHLSPTLGNGPSNICKVKPQQQMIHEEESSFCVNLNDVRDRDVNAHQNDANTNFQMSVSGQLPSSWSGIDSTNSGTVTGTEAALSIGTAIQALHLEEAHSGQVDALTKTSLLEMHSEMPGVQSIMEQMAKFNASHGVLFDGSELFSASTYVVTYPNTMLNSEYPPALSTEVVWPNTGLDAFQVSSKSVDINNSLNRMNFLANMDPSLSFSAASNAMLLSSNSPASVSPSAINASTAYPSIVNMGSNGTSLLTGMEFSPLLPHQMANSSFLTTFPPPLGPNQMTNVAAAYQPHLHSNSAPPSAGLNPIFQSGNLNAGFGGPHGTQLDVTCGNGNPSTAAGMQHFYAMLQQQAQLPSAAACPNVAGLLSNFPGQPLISPAGAANPNSLINAHPNAFLRQDSHPITTLPTGPSNAPQHSALFMYNPQAAPPHVSILPTAASNAAPPAARTNFLGPGFTHPAGLHAMHGTGAMVQLGTATPTHQHGTRGTPRFSATAAGVSICDYQTTPQSIDMLPIAGSGTAALFAPPLNIYSATPTLHAPVSAPSLFSSASGFPFKALPAPPSIPPQPSMLSAPHSVLGNYLHQHQHPIAPNLHSQYNKTLHPAYSTIRQSLNPASLLNAPHNFLASGVGARLATIPGAGPQLGHQTLTANQSINVLTNPSVNQGRPHTNSLLPSTSSTLNYENQQADVLPHLMSNEFKQMVVQMSRFRPVNSGRLNSASLLPSYLGNAMEVNVTAHQAIHNSQSYSVNAQARGGSTHKKYQNNYYHRFHSNASNHNNSNDSGSHRESSHITTTTVSTMSIKTSGSHNPILAETMVLEKTELENEGQNTTKSLEDHGDVPLKVSFGAVDETRDDTKPIAMIDPPSVVTATSSSHSHPSSMSILTAPLQPTILRNGLSE